AKKGVRIFFSSRGRHTSSTRDWSSDVCSSHLFAHSIQATVPSDAWIESAKLALQKYNVPVNDTMLATYQNLWPSRIRSAPATTRSEERRVGKDCRQPRAPHQGPKTDHIVVSVV